MDYHQLITYAHIAFAVFALILLLLRAFPLLAQGLWQPERTVSNKILVGLQHLSYSIVVFSGLWLLWANKFDVQPWFYAKVVLFFVMLSASAKAFNRRKEMLLVQRQAGVVIAIVAYCALFGLVMLKPQFG